MLRYKRPLTELIPLFHIKMITHKIIIICCFYNTLKLYVYGSMQNSINYILRHSEKIVSKRNCVLNIVEDNLSCGTVITISTPEDDLNFWFKSLTNSNCYVVTNIQDLNLLAEVYIIINNANFSEFQGTIKKLANNTFWNGRANFIILFEEQEEYERKDVFKLLLQYNIINVIVIDYREINSTATYTYFPYEIGVCGRHINNIINLGTCKNINAFPDKLKDGLRNCFITVAITEDTPFIIFNNNPEYRSRGITQGMEQFLISNIGQRENISINYLLVSHASRHGIVLSNRSSTGLLDYLDKNTADMIAGGFLLTKNRAQKYDYIYNYNYPIIQLYISSSRVANWTKVYKKFNSLTWILIGITYCLVSVIIATISNFSKKSRYTQHLFLKIWGYFFGNTDKNLIKEKNLRSILIFWIWFTFFICSFYTTTFYSFLSIYHKGNLNINFYNLSALPFKSCINDDVRTFFKFSYNLTLPRKYSDECKIEDESLDIVSRRNDLFTVEIEYTYILRKDEFTDDDGNPKLDYYNLANTISSLFVSRGFPFTKLFQKHATYCFESGLVKKHLDKIYSKNHPNEYKLKKRKFKKFTLDDLRIIFIILFVGYSISIVTFIIETNNPPQRRYPCGNVALFELNT